VKLKRGLHEVHLVALKADFELYLNRVLTVVWAGHFPSIVKKYLSKGYFSKREQAALRSLTSPELFIERVVPNYGLDALLETLKNTTEITLPNDLKDYEPSEWGQVQVAFQVRHLIEHLDGKVDDGFRRRVREFWKESSWGKTHHELDTLVKVTVNEIDVACTYNAMRQAAHSLTDALILWDSKQILAHKQF